MVAGVPKSSGSGHKIELTQGLNFTASITGGDEHARRFGNNYSKLAHAQQDQARAVEHEFPNISMPYSIGSFK
jgi:hypothetical protein